MVDTLLVPVIVTPSPTLIVELLVPVSETVVALSLALVLIWTPPTALLSVTFAEVTVAALLRTSLYVVPFSVDEMTVDPAAIPAPVTSVPSGSCVFVMMVVEPFVVAAAGRDASPPPVTETVPAPKLSVVAES
jgi:hypothetical protein